MRSADSKPARGRGWVVLATTLVALVLVLEVGLRVLLRVASEERQAKYARPGDLPPERSRYVPHPYLSYALNPAYRSADGRARHDALGFRGPETTRAKPAGTYRIVCLGGSTVYDTEIAADEDTFVAQLQAILRAEHPEVEVLNGGVGGYTSFETLIDLALRILEVEPDLVVLYQNSNDVHTRVVPPGAYRFDNTGYRHAWTETSPWWDRSMLVRYLGVQWGFSPRNTLEEHTKVPLDEERDLEACLAGNPPTWILRNTEEMVLLARSRGAAFLLTSFATCPARGGYPALPAYREGFAQHDAAQRALAERLDVPYYDFAAEMPLDLELWDDGVHNTAPGARRKAELFAAFIAGRFLRAPGDG